MGVLFPMLIQDSAAARVLPDSAAVLHQAPFPGVDSVVVESPLPGGVATVARFLFGLPQWFQIGGAVLGILVALVVLVWLWRRRRPIWQWVTTREKRLQWALAAGLFLLLLGAAGAGTASWNYMQHDNGFCTSCHVMDPAFTEFVAHEDKHDTLQCHDCHQQSIYASMRQLYLWVADRPEKIGPHAGVPNAVCEQCHVTGERETWQRIASTAGHRVHLESDSATMQDLQCITCHGVEVHRFVPVSGTCGQSGCHEESDTRIRLGDMADQTALHCTACHQFTADVPLLATVDSARGTLVPAERQCLGCHEMRAVLADFDAAREPHGGTCGTCHNPHTQATPVEASKSCASAQCHSDWQVVPFHVGPDHRRSGAQCQTCHQPHQSRVDASNCEGCHQSVRERTRLRPPVAFDTAAALRPPPIALEPGPLWEEPLRGKGDPPPEDDPSGVVFWGMDSDPYPDALLAAPGQQPAASSQQPDSFPHSRHRRHACIECHTTTGGHGRLTFEPPRGCDICHHQVRQPSPCSACHQTAELEPVRQVALRIAVPEHQARSREVAFLHSTHAERACADCHTTPITMALAPAARDCRNCHEEHHAARRDCAACHQNGNLREAHKPVPAPAVPQTVAKDVPPDVHFTCATCHTTATIALLTPTRAFCGTCHQDQRREHYEPRECTVCHFLAEPGQLRSRISNRPPA